MSKEKARGFVEHLLNNPELVDKMKGFTVEELKEAHEDLVNEGKIKDSDELIPHPTY